MNILKTSTDLQAYTQKIVSKHKRIGFVHTMGALHDGHLSLVRKAKKENEIVLVSIFVNPLQFNNQQDFILYPQTTHEDLAMLAFEDVDALFLPSAEDIYPPSFVRKHYDIGLLENVYEGFFRPGHFQGVCQVVDLLLSLVQPTNLYLGRKDYQQCLVLQKAVLNPLYPEIRLHICPTIRETDGLAMSSRNKRLSTQERIQATFLYQTLQDIKNHVYHFHKEKQRVIEMLATKHIQVEYLDLVDSEDLQPVTKQTNPLSTKMLIIAARVGAVRLIDNVEL